MPQSTISTTSLAALPLAICLSAACASHRIPYGDVSLQLDYSGRRAVAVAVIDARTRLGEGRHDPSVVGETMAGGARRKPITTADGGHLADSAAAALVGALEAAGFSPSIVEARAGEDREAVRERALEASADYLWLLDIDDWWTARHRRTTHTYELSFAVLEAGGGVLLERTLEGTVRWDQHGEREGGPDRPAKPAAEAAPAAPEQPAATPDPDSFEQPGSGPGTGTTDMDTPAEEAPSVEETAGKTENAGVDPVADYLVFLLGDLLHRMVNDPEVPRMMVRFP